MIPQKQRRIIEETFELYGKDIELREDDRVRDGTFYVVDDSPRYVVCCTRYVNYARDIRDRGLVPEIYSSEASTWA